LSQGKTDKSKRQKDGSGYHHPMGVFPIERKVQHLAIAPVISPSPSAQSRPMRLNETISLAIDPLLACAVPSDGLSDPD
jgi:hypothetical protein